MGNNHLKPAENVPFPLYPVQCKKVKESGSNTLVF